MTDSQVSGRGEASERAPFRQGKGPDAFPGAYSDDASAADSSLGPFLMGLVALAGAGTMVVELGAVRLLAPWFGTSSSVWTNVIGVVLAALALGYALGARLASRPRPLRGLALALLTGAAFSASLPFLAHRVAGTFMPDGVALHEAAGLLVWGSLAAALVLFLPAAAALGCAGPLAVEALQRSRGGAAGAAGGRVLAASTLGSLAGTFGTTHVLIPALGTRLTFLVASVALLLAGLAALLRSRRDSGGGLGMGPSALLVLFAVAASATMGVGAARSSVLDGERLLASVDSSMQSLRVVEYGEGEERVRLLRVNESLDSFQSVWIPRKGLLPPGHYYDQFALPYAWRTRELGQAPDGWDLLVLGLGAGTAVRVLEGVVDDATPLRSVGIEIDPTVVELGAEYFELENDGVERVAVGGLDARSALRLLDESFDQVIVDAYANNMEIPPHLASVDAFRAIEERLAVGGWLTVNIGGFGLDDPVVDAVARAAALGMGTEVHVVPVPFTRNLTLFARKGRPVPAPGTRAFGSLGTPLVAGLGRLVAPLSAPGVWQTLAVENVEGASTDDSSATESLQLASIQAASARRDAWNRALLPRGENEAEYLSTDPSVRAQAEAARALFERADVAGAFEAAGAVDGVGERAAVIADLRWRSGTLGLALDAVIEGLASAPRHAGLLRLAADLGFILGADSGAAACVRSLQKGSVRAQHSDEAQRFWAAELTRLGATMGAAEVNASNRRRGLLHSKVAIGAVLGLLLLGAWIVVRRSVGQTVAT